MKEINVGDKLYNGFNEVSVEFIFDNPQSGQKHIIAFVPSQGGLRQFSDTELTTEPALFVCLNDAGDTVAEINVMERAGDQLSGAALVIKITKQDNKFVTETVHEREIVKEEPLAEIMSDEHTEQVQAEKEAE